MSICARRRRSSRWRGQILRFSKNLSLETFSYQQHMFNNETIFMWILQTFGSKIEILQGRIFELFSAFRIGKFDSYFANSKEILIQFDS